MALAYISRFLFNMIFFLTILLPKYYQNVRGLRTKVHSFYPAATLCEFDCIGLPETWLSNDNDVSNCEHFATNRVGREFQNTIFKTFLQ